MPKLFFVRAESQDGENLDLLVRADDKDEAKEGWNAYYNDGGPVDHPSSCVHWVGEVPIHGAKGGIDWGLINPS